MNFLLLLVSASLAVAAPEYTPGFTAIKPGAYVPGKAFNRFVTIWLENQDFLRVENDPDIATLRKQGILLTEYYGLTHPSQPNYIASVGGDYFGLNHDGFVRIPQNVSTLIDLFDTKGIDWRGYFEDYPGPGYMYEGSTASDGSGWDYVRKHNPFVSFDSVNLNSTRLLKLQSFSEFQHDVANDALPQYAHLSPNMLNDGHNTSLEYATNWTTSFLKPLLADFGFMEDTLVLLTYDESQTYSEPNRIVSLLLGGAIPDKLKGTTDDTAYTHYSILSTLQNNWELPNLGRYDVGANVFQMVADITGYKNHPPGNLGSIDNSISYAGFLNKNADSYRPIPAPNLQLTGAGGQGVVGVVKKTWASASGEDTPYNGSGDVYDGGNGTLALAPNAPVYQAQATNAVSTGTATVAPTRQTSTSGAGKENLHWAAVMVGLVAFAAFVLL
ncbi:hypothetical protein BP6252_03524 [Coleophoma cylindrospora]|uniref:Uncharacterized protein n=1 Tax=Coleophoma cylindrospora TaxID=1849047 RepID=A0A3D8S7Y0_9HELO|nr:hypothetical protein BP6252_03524 [Coleophoma cylindrospora]